jgi:hypothetical protein
MAVDLYYLNARSIFLNPPVLRAKLASLDREFAELQASIANNAANDATNDAVPKGSTFADEELMMLQHEE